MFWSPRRRTWSQSSLLTLCGSEIAPVFIDVFLTYHPPHITASSWNYLARPFTVCCRIFPLSIVTIRPMLIHSLPSFFILPSLTAFPTMQENVCWYEEILSACYILHFFIAGSGQKVLFLLLAIPERCRQEKEVSFAVGESDQRSGLGCSAPGTSEVLSYHPPVIIPKSNHWALLKIWFIQSIRWRDRRKSDSFYKK